MAAERAAVLVCSVACGADLVALEAAERLGRRRRIVLPFAAERFRMTSVTDRPGDWGPMFDRMIAAADATDALFADQSQSILDNLVALLRRSRAWNCSAGNCGCTQRDQQAQFRRERCSGRLGVCYRPHC